MGEVRADSVLDRRKLSAIRKAHEGLTDADFEQVCAEALETLTPITRRRLRQRAAPQVQQPDEERAGPDADAEREGLAERCRKHGGDIIGLIEGLPACGRCIVQAKPTDTLTLTIEGFLGIIAQLLPDKQPEHVPLTMPEAEPHPVRGSTQPVRTRPGPVVR